MAINFSDEQYEKALNLELAKKIVTFAPSIYIGGSLGLFLHGIRIKRWLNENSDLDLWNPYYINLKELEIIHLKVEEKKDDSENSNTKDYKNSIQITEPTTSKQVKVDLGIDPFQTYDIIKYKGFNYKVNRLENIWSAKLKYKNPKHVADLKEAMNIDTFKL